jgi:acyl carrier protein
MWDNAFDSIVRSHLTVPAGATLPPTDLLADHGLDSMGTVTLLVALEEEFAVTFPDDLLVPETFATAGSLWTALSGLSRKAA